MEYELRKIELQGNMTSISDGSAVKQTDLFKLMSHFDGKDDITIYLLYSRGKFLG